MSLQDLCTMQLDNAHEWFARSTRSLAEEDGTFAPEGECFTAAQQVAHVAQTIDWFVEGAFRPDGFDMDFATHEGEVRKVTSLAAARAWLTRSVSAAKKAIAAHDDAAWAAPLPEGPVMGGLPRHTIFGAIADHTAHHRGALTVYTRLRGKVPPMPYMETDAGA